MNGRDEAGPSQPRQRKGGLTKQQPQRVVGQAGPSNGGRAQVAPLRVREDEVEVLQTLIRNYAKAAETKKLELGRKLASTANGWGDYEEGVSRIVRHMLFAQRTKPNSAVSRANLHNEIANYNPNLAKMGAVEPIIAGAQHSLISIFGMEMVCMVSSAAQPPSAPPAPSSSKVPKSTTKEYTLMSCLPLAIRKEVIYPKDSHPICPHDAFTFVVLSVIHVKRGMIMEDDLWKELVQLGVREDEDHPVFKHCQEQIKRMEDQRYIKKVTPPAGLSQLAGSNVASGRGPQAFVFGGRTLQEIGEARVDEWVESLFTRRKSQGKKRLSEADPDQIIELD